ncbi:MAG: hypothetical protein QM526_01030 [Alphaproteobacteria bacterium]|nr:hypothetical protein [Alphaproteobacteria bacterium]
MFIKPFPLFSVAFEKYKSNASVFFLLAFIPTCATLIAELGFIYFGNFQSIFSTGVGKILSIALVALYIVLFVFTTLVSKIFIVDPKTNFKKASGRATEIGFAWVLVFILTWLAVVGSSFLFLIPGLILFMYTLFAEYAILKDNKHGIQALAHSWSIVSNKWWNMFWCFVLFTTAIIILNGVFVFIIEYIAGFSFVWESVIASTLAIFLSQAILLPYSGHYFYSLYTELSKSAKVPIKKVQHRREIILKGAMVVFLVGVVLFFYIFS